MSEDKLIVHGGQPLKGTVTVPGTKHGMVLAVAAAVATRSRLTLSDVPDITDRRVLARIVRALGGSVTEAGSVLHIDGAITRDEIPGELSKLVHGSLYLLPAVLAARGSVVFHGAGGDSLGSFEHGLARPIQHMLDMMKAFGADWEWDGAGTLRVHASRLTPARLNLLRWSTDPERPEGPQVSGTSKTALLLAAAAGGTSVLRHPHAREAQHELIGVLRALGVAVDQRDACWLVDGGQGGSEGAFRLMPCPVEFATWLAIAVVTRSELDLRCGDQGRLVAAIHRELDFLAALGIEPVFDDTAIRVGPPPGPYPGRELLAECTGISTDIAPLLALILNGAAGRSTVEDRIWGTRFGYAAQLNLLGAGMNVVDGKLVIDPAPLRPATRPLRAEDTRSAAVCLAAALTVPGPTTVYGGAHLDRGYTDFTGRLQAIGADVTHS